MLSQHANTVHVFAQSFHVLRIPARSWRKTFQPPRCAAGGHIVHVGSALGQLEGIPLEGVKAYIRGAKSVQEIVDLPYPAEELAQVCAATS